MTTSMMIAIPVVVMTLRLLRPIWRRTSARFRERIQILGPFVLALAFVVLATLGYLELVAVLLDSIE